MKMTFQQKKEALSNALAYYNFPAKYYVFPTSYGKSDYKFAIASTIEHGAVDTHTRFMTYDEFNAFLFGFDAAHQGNKFQTAAQPPKPYIVIEIKGGTVKQIYSTEPIQFQVIDHDIKEVNSADQLAIPVEIKSANDIDGVCILAENKFLSGKREIFESPDDWDWEQEFENGPTGHGDICHSDADSGL